MSRKGRLEKDSGTHSGPWRTDKPDDDLTVLLRLRDPDWPIVIGFHEEGRWHESGADEIAEKDVVGWMDLHAAAAMLDANTSGQPRLARTTKEDRP